MVREGLVWKLVLFFSIPLIKALDADTEKVAVISDRSNQHGVESRGTGGYCLAPQGRTAPFQPATQSQATNNSL